MKRVSLALLALAGAAPLGAQVMLDRPPNLSGTWVGEPGVIQFNFVHRFYVSPSPSYSVTNFPTFTFATGLPAHLGLGIHYSTRSETPGHINEIELFARWRRSSGPFSLAVTPAWNGASKSADGEVSAEWTYRHVTLVGALRGMSKPFRTSTARAALAGGAVLRFNDYVAVGADLASFVNPESGEAVAWSAGLLFVIPGSPHMFSLHASNVGVNTIEGSSRRGSLFGLTNVLYGFEFTIPLHLKRFSPWFHKAPKPVTIGGPAGAAIASEVRMSSVKFIGDTITIAAGQAVRWTNADPVEHTVTFDGAAEPGSPVIRPNGSYVHRFDKPGTYTYHCTPHPFMKGVVVVR